MFEGGLKLSDVIRVKREYARERRLFGVFEYYVVCVCEMCEFFDVY